MSDLSLPTTAFGLGLALGAAPGPVHVLLLSEASRGGIRRGLRVMVGVTAVFLTVLVALAVGLSFVRPGDTFLRIVRIAGGAFLLWLAADAFRAAKRRVEAEDAPASSLDPVFRGMLAVALNPGAWVFLAATASAVVGDAVVDGGAALALLTGAAMVVGTGLVDFTVVLLASGGRRVLTERGRRRVDYVLAAALVGIGVWFILQGIV